MINEAQSNSPSRVHLLDELAAARDVARLELHLLSMDARKSWNQLESKLSAWERRLGPGNDIVPDALSVGMRDLTRAVGEFFKEHTEPHCPELETPVRRMMTTAVRSCHPRDNLEQAARIMWEADCGAVPVVASGGVVVGMITDRDIAMAGYLRGQTLSSVSVESVMSKQLYVCVPDDSARHALRTMSYRQIRRLPVVSERGELLGIVALTDIAAHLESSQEASSILAHSLASIGERRFSS